VVKLYTVIWNVLGWNRGRETGYPELDRFPQSFEANAGLLLQLGNDRFLPDPFQFFIHQSYHSTQYRRRYGQRRKINHKQQQ
jgi:hypothetical protein